MMKAPGEIALVIRRPNQAEPHQRRPLQVKATSPVMVEVPVNPLDSLLLRDAEPFLLVDGNIYTLVDDLQTSGCAFPFERRPEHRLPLCQQLPRQLESADVNQA